MDAPKLTNAQRAAIAAEWRRSSYTQRQFCEMLRVERHMDVTPRALRLWVERFGSSRYEVDHLVAARQHLAGVVEGVRHALAQVEVLLADVDVCLDGARHPTTDTSPPPQRPATSLHQNDGDPPPLHQQPADNVKSTNEPYEPPVVLHAAPWPYHWYL